MYFCIDNCVSPDVREFRPWDFDVSNVNFDLDPDPATSKDLYKKLYFKNPKARHCLFSLARGVVPDLVVTSGSKAENPCAELHGFVGDYDSTVGENVIESLQRAPKGPYLPTRWSETQGRNFRLVWEFDEPVRVVSSEHANRLLEEIANRIKAAAWGSMFDRKACTNCAQHFDVGRRWGVFSTERLPSQLLRLWDYEVFNKYRKTVKTSYNVPLDDAAEECRSQFPGRITFPFIAGGRCNRFWDPQSDNMDGCVICEEGIRVFVPHDKPFMSWADILGMKFVDKYASAKIADVVTRTWFNNSNGTFVRWKEEERKYVSRDVTTMRRDLTIEGGLNAGKKKGELVSEVDTALHDITARREVEYAAPILFFPHGPMKHGSDGTMILNTSTVRVTPPTKDDFIGEDEELTWDDPRCHERFPFIHGVVSTMFELDPATAMRRIEEGFSEPVPETRQLQVFLSWLSAFYEGAARLHPTQGQCLVCAGPTGIGKSLLFQKVVGPLMGGCNASCEDYYVAGSKFTDGLLNAPIHLLDDVIADLDYKTRAAFTTRLKVVVATAKLRYEAKFKNAVPDVPWLGRPVILCNMDPRSLQILPGLEQSTADKITMLKLGPVKFPFFGGKDRMKNVQLMAQELPFFAKFILHYRRPAELFDRRMGVKAYQHPDMKAAAAGNDYTTAMVDALHILVDSTADSVSGRIKAGTGGVKAFRGNARQLFDLLESASPSAARDIGGARPLSQQLIRMSEQGYKIEKRRYRGSWEFTIYADFDSFEETDDDRVL